MAVLGACVLATPFAVYSLLRHHPERLRILLLSCVCALVGIVVSLKITLDVFSAQHLYGVLKVAATLLLCGDLVLLSSALRHARGRLPGHQPGNTLDSEVVKRVQAEESQRLSENRFRTIFDNARDVITYVDSGGRIIDVNQRVADVFGYKPEELIGKCFTQIGLLRAKDIPKILLLFCETLISGKATEIVELELRHKNGGSVFVEVGTRFIRQSGRVKEIVSVFRDITEHRQARARPDAATVPAEATSWEPCANGVTGEDADLPGGIPLPGEGPPAPGRCLPVGHGIDMDLDALMNGVNAGTGSSLA
jgi:PAS domain S-box-containing protein